jgi:hypothetical protein
MTSGCCDIGGNHSASEHLGRQPALQHRLRMGVRQDHLAKAQAVRRVGQRAPPAQQRKWLAGAAFEPPVWAMNPSDDEINELVLIFD